MLYAQNTMPTKAEKRTHLIHFLLFLLCFALFCSSLALAEPEGTERIEYYTVTGRNNISALYHPEMLLVDANTGRIDPDIAKLSVLLADAAYDKSSVTKMLIAMGCDTPNFWNYDVVDHMPYDDCDHEAFSIAHASYKQYNIYFVPIKGTSKNMEWVSDFNLHSDTSGRYHAGFFAPTMQVYNLLRSTLAETPKETNIVLLTGHSRGAAISNMVAGLLQDRNANVEARHLFSYNYATPAVGKGLTKYQNIININNRGDLITLLPRQNEYWQYERYGVDKPVGPFDGTVDGSYYNSVLDEVLLKEEDYEGLHYVFDFISYFLMDDNKRSSDYWQAYLQKYSGDLASSFTSFIVTLGKTFTYSSIFSTIETAHDVLPDCQALLNQCLIYGWNDSEVQDKLSIINQKLTQAGLERITGQEMLETTISRYENAHTAGTVVRKITDLFLQADGKIKDAIWDGHRPESYISYINHQYCGYQSHKSERITANVFDSILSTAGTTIAPGAFSGCIFPEGYSIPAHIRAIGPNAFEESLGTENLVIPKTIDWIGSDAFNQCEDIRTIELPVELTKWGVFSTPNLEEIHYTVKDTGIMPDKDSDSNRTGYLESCSGPNLKTVVFDKGVVAIGSYAFNNYNGNSAIENVYLPSTLRSVGDQAFNCQYTMKITQSIDEPPPENESDIPSYLGESAFRYCNGIEELVRINGLTSISSRAYCLCSSLKTVNIPEGVTNIGFAAFISCQSLESVTFPSTLETIEDSAFSGYRTGCLVPELTFPDSLTTIGPQAFENWTNISELVIPDSVSSIGARAFDGWTSLTDLTIPVDVARPGIIRSGIIKNIHFTKGHTGIFADQDASNYPNYGSATFSMLANEDRCLKTIVFEDGVISIPEALHIYNSYNIDSLVLPDSIEYLGDWAFSGFLAPVTNALPKALKYVGSHCYFQATGLGYVNAPDALEYIGDNAFQECTNLDLVLPDTVQHIGDRAFQDCASLTINKLPSSLESLGYCAFMGCSSLTVSELPPAITKINHFFEGCSSITEFHCHDNITSITASAFKNCSNLETITLSSNLNELGDDCFLNTKIEKLVIPDTLSTIPLLGTLYGGTSMLKEIFLGKNEYTVKENAFYGLTLTVIMQDETRIWSGRDYGGTTTWKHIDLYNMENEGVTVPIDNEHFSDPVFRQLVADNFDQDGDMILSPAEIYEAQWATFDHSDPYSDGYTSEDRITSLKGIEQLVFLTFLDINYQHVSEMDLSHNTRLDSLYCVGNGLTNLNLSKNPKIEYLYCQNNQLTFLDLSNQKNLMLLDCGENPLTGVITDSDELYDFWCTPYTVNLTARNGFFDLQSLAGFDTKKAFDWAGATFLDHYLIMRDSDTITYTYDCGSGRTADFEWYVTVEPGDAVMTLPAALKSIESEAFRSTSADRYIIPDETETIGDYAFADLKKPAWIQIPATVTSIADHAFDSSIVAIETAQQSDIEQWCSDHQVYCFPVQE